ncbi:hypothetical protein M2164_000320 [Streptomyces sp. SAI-208]|nr:hypothetical protein [Streptomyces sp. SAI-208]
MSTSTPAGCVSSTASDAPAQIITELAEWLRQTPLGVALTACTGPDRSIGYRWFTDPTIGHLYAPGERFLGVPDDVERPQDRHPPRVRRARTGL